MESSTIFTVALPSTVSRMPLGVVVVLEVLPSLAVVVSPLVPSGLVVVSTFPVLPESSRSEDEPPPEEELPEDWA